MLRVLYHRAPLCRPSACATCGVLQPAPHVAYSPRGSKLAKNGVSFYNAVMGSKDVDEMAYSGDPDPKGAG